MSLIHAYRNRGITKDLQILDGDDAVVVPVTDDVLRVVICRLDELDHSTMAGAELTVTSDAATSNGSSLSKNSPSSGTHRLRLDAQDLTFKPGIYTLIFEIQDSADGDDWKNIDRQVFSLEEL